MAKQVVTYTFASILDRYIYQWLAKDCEGCEVTWVSQRDQSCLNFGSIENMNSGYFRGMQHLIQDNWVIRAARDYIGESRDAEVLKVQVEELRSTGWKTASVWWTELTCLKRSTISEIPVFICFQKEISTQKKKKTWRSINKKHQQELFTSIRAHNKQGWEQSCAKDRVSPASLCMDTFAVLLKGKAEISVSSMVYQHRHQAVITHW